MIIRLVAQVGPPQVINLSKLAYGDKGMKQLLSLGGVQKKNSIGSDSIDLSKRSRKYKNNRGFTQYVLQCVFQVT